MSITAFCSSSNSSYCSYMVVVQFMTMLPGSYRKHKKPLFQLLHFVSFFAGLVVNEADLDNSTSVYDCQLQPSVRVNLKPYTIRHTYNYSRAHYVRVTTVQRAPHCQRRSMMLVKSSVVCDEKWFGQRPLHCGQQLVGTCHRSAG